MINKQCPSWVVKQREFQKGVSHAVDTIFLDDAKETRGHYQHRDSVVINNLDMIFDKLQTKNLSAEDYVSNKLKRMGYKVIDCRMAGGVE